jgi:hypothetical protein
MMADTIANGDHEGGKKTHSKDPKRNPVVRMRNATSEAFLGLVIGTISRPNAGDQRPAKRVRCIAWLASTAPCPWHDRLRNRQNKVIIAGTKVIDLEPGDRVLPSPDDDSDPAAAGSLANPVADRLRSMLGLAFIEVDARASAFASRHYREGRN